MNRKINYPHPDYLPEKNKDIIWCDKNMYWMHFDACTNRGKCCAKCGEYKHRKEERDK